MALPLHHLSKILPGVALLGVVGVGYRVAETYEANRVEHNAGAISNLPEETGLPSRSPSPDRIHLPSASGKDNPPKNATHANQPEKPSGVLPEETDEQKLEATLARLPKGNLVYDAPEKMKQTQTARVTVRIGSNKVQPNVLQFGLTQHRGSGETLITPKMEVTLTGADFKISALSSPEQSVGGSTPTNWEWDVIPLKAGKLRLHYAAVIRLKDISKDFTTRDEDIEVEIDPVDVGEKFIEKHFEWTAASIVGVMAAAWKFRSGRRKKTGPSAEGSMDSIDD